MTFGAFGSIGAFGVPQAVKSYDAGFHRVMVKADAVQQKQGKLITGAQYRAKLQRRAARQTGGGAYDTGAGTDAGTGDLGADSTSALGLPSWAMWAVGGAVILAVGAALVKNRSTVASGVRTVSRTVTRRPTAPLKHVKFSHPVAR